jgi:hypothetical protein
LGGKYTVRDILGRGATGVTYRVRAPPFARHTGVKQKITSGMVANTLSIMDQVRQQQPG